MISIDTSIIHLHQFLTASTPQSALIAHRSREDSTQTRDLLELSLTKPYWIQSPMEPAAAKLIWSRSVEKHKLCYTTFIRDGDSKVSNRCVRWILKTESLFTKKNVWLRYLNNARRGFAKYRRTTKLKPLFTPFSIGFVLHRYKLIFATYTKGL